MCSRDTLPLLKLATGQLERDLSAETPRMRQMRQTLPPKLEMFTSVIQERLTAYPALSSVRLHAECRAAGYAGG